MQHTTNYNLSQYDATDRVTRDAFNADNFAIDAALKSVSDAAASAQSTASAAQSAAATALAAASAAGNCTLHYITHIGTGTTDPITVSIPEGKPIIVFVNGYDGLSRIYACRPSDRPRDYRNTSIFYNTSWGDHSFTWNCTTDADKNFNREGCGYHVVILAIPD